MDAFLSNGADHLYDDALLRLILDCRRSIRAVSLNAPFHEMPLPFRDARMELMAVLVELESEAERRGLPLPPGNEA